MSDEQNKALSVIDKEISISLIKKFAIISEALGKTMPKVISGPLDNLIVDTSLARLPTIKTSSILVQDEEEATIELTIGQPSIYYIEDDICHDGEAEICCTGKCPC